MRYIVVVQQDVTFGDVFSPEELDEECERDPEDVHHQDVSKVILCADTKAVAKAVRENAGWCVFEAMPDGTTRQRAIVQKMDGKHVYDVEVS